MSENITSQKIVSGVFWRFAEKITAQLVSFIVSIVLARLLMPEDYGLVAVMMIFIAIAEVFVTSGLGTSLVQKKEADEVDFSSIFWINIIFSLCLYFVFFLVAPFISGFYDLPELTPVLRVFAIRLPIAAINSIQNAYVSKKMDFKKFFFATIIGTVCSAVIGITLALKGFGVWALVCQNLTNSIVDTIVLFFIISWKPKFVISLNRAKPLIQYGWKILTTDLIGVSFNQIQSFIIGKKYTTSDLAYFQQGKKLPDLLNNNIINTLSAVLFPAMSNTSDIEQIKEIRRKSLRMLEYVMFPLMFGLIAVADNLVLVLFTEKWAFAIPYVRIVCLDSLIGILGTTLIQEIKAIGRSDITLKMELIKKPVFLVVVLISMQFGVKGVAFSLIINEILAFIFNVYPVKKYIGFDFKVHLMDAFPAFIMSIVMGTVVFIGKLISNNLLCLIVQVVIGAVIYIELSIVTKNESYLYLKNMIFRKLNK